MQEQSKIAAANNIDKISTYLFALLSGIFMPIIEMLLFCGFMILIDTMTGIWAASKRGEVISSKKMKNAIPKMIIYPLALIVASWAERILPGIPFVKGSATLLIVIEGKSLLENANDILGYNLLKLVKLYIVGGKDAVLKHKMDKNDEKDVK